MILMTLPQIMAVVIIRDLHGLGIVQGHDEGVDDVLNGGRARKDVDAAERELRHQLNLFHRKITTALLMPEPTIDL
jgi:hypothetical protein